MDFSKPGILQIGDERTVVKVLEYDHEWGCLPRIQLELLDMLSASNVLAKSRVKDEIEKVIFNDPATIVIWSDGTKTVVKCQEGDKYSKELGLAMCISKKYLGNKGNFNETFKKWIPEESEYNVIAVEEMRDELLNYCRTSDCDKCKLHSPVCRCGSGTHFKITRSDGGYDMTDQEIRDAYKIVFGKRRIKK